MVWRSVNFLGSFGIFGKTHPIDTPRPREKAGDEADEVYIEGRSTVFSAGQQRQAYASVFAFLERHGLAGN